MVSVSLIISFSSSEPIPRLEDPSSSYSSIIGERRWGWGNGVIMMASSPSPWLSGRVLLRVTSNTDDEMSCISLLREGKGAVSQPRNWLGKSIGLDGDR